MDILTTREDFAAALSRAAGVAEKRSTTPILSSVLIQALASGDLRLTATDKASTYTGVYRTTVNAPGEVAVNVHELSVVVNALRPGALRAVFDGARNRLTLTSGTTTTRLDCYAPADFPVTPKLDAAADVEFDAADLRKAIDQVIACVAPEDNRYGLNGALLEKVGDLARFVATDGNRLAWSELPFTGDLAVPTGTLLPRKGLTVARKLMDGHDGAVRVSIGRRAAVFTIGAATLHLRLLEATFPDYRQVLPTAHKRCVAVERREFTEAIRRVGIFAADGARTIRFAFTPDGAVLTARKLDAGDAREEVPAELEGEPITMGFNSAYLREALGVMTGDRALLHLGDTLAPCVARDPDDERFQIVVMPVRLD